ncbi:SpoIIIAH-like family protein [Paenibacillus sp. LHD-117]|uniref:SpoIIIAH-like family protein n=1 Tax=Paenibacillus sp. LHD-117 TaxID=3071412 RepID=UPI0027DEC47B|nr:SpoIIIAH-like family protein [Paenibacillus sp. LHD-117]MDQ6421051.1 SpoIIIAH-like family protein [Paenibacillus sp. LHD-117]
MNTKRQTIWLVSMLSLMVVLSAYYLFTQDLDDTDKLSGSGEKTEDVSEVTGESKDGLVVDEVSQEGDGEISAADKEVLEQLERDGVVSVGLFGELMSKREQQYSEEQDRIHAVIANTGESTEEEISAAMKELELLEDKNSRITDLESALMEQYEMALISPENDRYKVVVTSQKLEKKDAANIIEQVMKTLEVKPDQVSVQYVPAP